jgi:hypothetical protein
MKISDRKYRVWNETCQHELNFKGTKHCGLALDEDTGECPKGHGRMLHGCATGGCVVWVSGNHKFCRYHRKSKLKSMMNVNNKIMRRYRSMMWGKLSKNFNMDDRQTKKDFEQWAKQQRETTYDPNVLKVETLQTVTLPKSENVT